MSIVSVLVLNPLWCVHTDKDRDQKANSLYETVWKCSHWPRPTDNKISWIRYRSVRRTPSVWMNHLPSWYSSRSPVWMNHTLTSAVLRGIPPSAMFSVSLAGSVLLLALSSALTAPGTVVTDGIPEWKVVIVVHNVNIASSFRNNLHADNLSSTVPKYFCPTLSNYYLKYK